ncbi:MAG: hypothetical protein ACJ8KA_16280 [Sulfurifustis sp.]
MNRIAKTVWCILALVVAIVVGACGLLAKGPPTTRLSAIEVIAEPGANRNSATALDVVFVYDTAVMELLPKTGPAWFQGKAALRTVSPRAFDVVELQLPPAYALKVALPKRSQHALRVMAYANYIAEEGQVALNLTDAKHALIRLKPAAIEYRDE